MMDKTKIKVDRTYKSKLLSVLRKDADFFARCQIIDYSLLVGIHNCKRPAGNQQRLQLDDVDAGSVESSARHSTRSQFGNNITESVVQRK